MNLAIVLVIAAFAALGIILRLTVIGSLKLRKHSETSEGIRPIDVQAFRNLANPTEDEYLRRQLPASAFRRVRRKRLWAMAAYVEVARINAGLLVTAGQAAIGSGDQRFAEPARQLVDEALLLRRNATAALMQIYIALAWPNSGFAAVRVIDRYEKVGGSAMLLGRLQNPAVAVRLSASR
jgi:hypothetical protein